MEKVMYPIEKLYLTLDKALNEEIIVDKNLQRKISEELSSKGMSNRFLTQLINEQVVVSSLNEIQIIALAKVCGEYLNWENLNLTKYFSDNQIISYQNYFVTQEDNLNAIEIKNCLKINEYKYLTSISYKQIYQLFRENLIIYNFETQRAANYKKIGSTYLKNISIDPETVKDIKATILAGKLNTSELVFNAQLIEGKQQNFKFTSDVFSDVLGDILIVPDFDTQSNSTTFVTILDGLHRSIAISQAYSEYMANTGKELEGEVSLKIVRMDVKEAKELVRQSFLKANIGASDEFKESLQENDYNKFIEMVESKSEYLKNNIANSYEEMKSLKKLTTRRIMTDVIKIIGIKVENSAERVFASKRVAANFDLLMEFLSERGLRNQGAVALYFYIACKCKDDTEVLETASEIELSKLEKYNNKKNINVKEIVSEVLEVNNNG